MTVKEARIILLCNNVVEAIYAQKKGALSEELLNQDGEGGFDLEILKEEAIKIVLDELQKQDTEINKLNKVIDRMAKKLSQVPIFTIKSKSNNYNADDLYTAPMSIEEIKEYFMKEDK